MFKIYIKIKKYLFLVFINFKLKIMVIGFSCLSFISGERLPDSYIINPSKIMAENSL